MYLWIPPPNTFLELHVHDVQSNGFRFQFQEIYQQYLPRIRGIRGTCRTDWEHKRECQGNHGYFYGCVYILLLPAVLHLVVISRHWMANCHIMYSYTTSVCAVDRRTPFTRTLSSTPTAPRSLTSAVNWARQRKVCSWQRHPQTCSCTVYRPATRWRIERRRAVTSWRDVTSPTDLFMHSARLQGDALSDVARCRHDRIEAVFYPVFPIIMRVVCLRWIVWVIIALNCVHAWRSADVIHDCTCTSKCRRTCR